MPKHFKLNDLLYLMSRLREPEFGCPWDLKQNYKSITASTIEEAYEVVDAIDREDYEHLKDELGDLLFQVVFYSQLAKEEKRFELDDVIHAITAKLLRRHPHVFPDGTLDSRRKQDDDANEESIKASWEAIKQEERKDKGKDGVFDDIPAVLPSMIRAVKLQKRAAKLGFDWKNLDQVLEKLDEEIAELKQAQKNDDSVEVANELGDLMFTCINVARHLGQDPELILRAANQKFESRARHVEKQLNDNPADTFSEEELDSFWQSAKQSDC